MNTGIKLGGFNRYNDNNEAYIKIECPTQMILKSAAKFIHKFPYTKRLSNIQKIMRIPTWREEGNKVPKYFPNKSKMKQNAILEGIRLFNSIRPEFRKLKTSRYKHELRKWNL